MNWNDVDETKNAEGYKDMTPCQAEYNIRKSEQYKMTHKEIVMATNELIAENIVCENDMDIMEVISEKKDEQTREYYRKDPVKSRFYKLLKVLFAIADLAGFRICGRIEIKDKKTGRVFR